MVNKDGQLTPLAFPSTLDKRSKESELLRVEVAGWAGSDLAALVSSVGHFCVQSVDFAGNVPPAFLFKEGPPVTLSSRNTRVRGPLFGLGALEITSDGTCDLVACNWEGQTYIMPLPLPAKLISARDGGDGSRGRPEDKEKHRDGNPTIIQFSFGERVSAFTAKPFAVQGVQGGRATPCLFYVTFEHELVVYVDIRLKRALMPHLPSDPSPHNFAPQVVFTMQRAERRPRPTLTGDLKALAQLDIGMLLAYRQALQAELATQAPPDPPMAILENLSMST